MLSIDDQHPRCLAYKSTCFENRHSQKSSIFLLCSIAEQLTHAQADTNDAQAATKLETRGTQGRERRGGDWRGKWRNSGLAWCVRASVGHVFSGSTKADLPAPSF